MTKTKFIAVVITGIIVITSMILYFEINPEATCWMPRCMFHDLTGWQCPGCGMQRAIHCMLHGNWSQAWHYNYALPFSALIIAFYTIIEFMRTKYNKLYLAAHSNIAITILLATTLAWWIVRNIFNI